MNQIEELKKAHEDLGKKIQELEKTMPKPDGQYTWEKCFSGTGHLIKDDSTIIKIHAISLHLEHRNIAHSEKVAKKMLATAQLSHIIAKANEGWEPDWSDSDQPKYCIARHHKDGLSLDTEYTDYCFLSFRVFGVSRIVLYQNERLIRDYFMMD
jgi:hypothetical protein